MIKAREVASYLKEHGTERGTIMVLTQIIEFQVAVNQQVNELTSTVDKLIDMVGGVAGGYKSLRDQVESVRNKIMPDERG